MDSTAEVLVVVVVPDGDVDGGDRGLSVPGLLGLVGGCDQQGVSIM